MSNDGRFIYDSKTEVFLRDQGTTEFNRSKSSIWVERKNFYGDGKPVKRKKGEKKQTAGNFMIIGFDTEFKTPNTPLSREDIKDGLGKYTVISYQVHGKIFRDGSEFEFSGICYPDKQQRLSLGEVLIFAFWTAYRCGYVGLMPDKLYLVGHFTRADCPAFSDFKSLTDVISNVRNTFLSIDQYIPIRFKFEDGSMTLMQVRLRDTMLLTPAASKSLRALGDLVGVEKVILDPDPDKETYYKENMDEFSKTNPDLFEKYAITDATICLRYTEQLLIKSTKLTGNNKVPATLTSIGIDLLLNNWEKQFSQSHLDILGQEEVYERYFDKKKGFFISKKTAVPLEEVHWFIDFVTSTYHGGRNEQFWFGPGFEDDWTDFDLSSAYPTAMSLIGLPDWKSIKPTFNLDDFTPTSLGFAAITFKFPDDTRFPTFPVRTDNGLVFPLEGQSNCSAPEVCLARKMGAEITIRHGVIVPTDSTQPIFTPFIKECLDNRGKYAKNTLDNLFWKELSNSTYGKTAQGLREKRVFDLRDKTTKPLPPSRITNAFFASFITSFVRAVLGEVINALPPSVCVFSCTTDGFLTNATKDQIDVACKGELLTIYNEARQRLTGKSGALEAKHYVRKPLGWRTRGQATLKEGVVGKDDENIVLAKGGIFTPSAYDIPREQNRYITNLFFGRTPESVITSAIKTGVRDMVTFDADLVEKDLIKRLNMEYDWKRCPSAVGTSANHDHLVFSTKPWKTVDEFQRIRQFWEEYTKTTPTCIKNIDDYKLFANYVMVKTSLGIAASKYLKKESPDINRLRQVLCSAWYCSAAGIILNFNKYSNAKFAAFLDASGIPCERADVENRRKKPFEPHSVPPTEAVYAALSKLKSHIHTLDIDLIVAKGEDGIDLLGPITTSCPFVDRVT